MRRISHAQSEAIGELGRLKGVSFQALLSMDGSVFQIPDCDLVGGAHAHIRHKGGLHKGTCEATLPKEVCLFLLSEETAMC